MGNQFNTSANSLAYEQSKDKNYSLNPTFNDSIFDPETLIGHVEGLVKKDASFPVNVFPSQIQYIIEETNKNLMFPADYIGASILYAVSLAIGNTHKAQVISGWNESAVLYLAIVGRPGTNKSHPLTFAIQPIVERDREAYKAYLKALAEYDAIASLSKKERKEEGIDELPEKPVLSKFLVSDFTLEALAAVHSNNLRGIGVYVDELAGFFKNFNRYNKGSEQEYWLSNWSGKPIISDRKSSSPINISNPFISVAGTIQNGILDELGKDNRNHNGFIDRILFILPDGVQKRYLSNSGINKEVTALYDQILSNLLSLQMDADQYGNPVSTILQFTDEAHHLFEAWYNKNVDLINNTPDEALAGTYAKLDTYTARFALILQMLYSACGELPNDAIYPEAVKGAIELAEYFRSTAAKVHSIVTNHSPLDKLPFDKKRLYEALPDLFQRDAGLKIAEGLGIVRATYDRFLTDKSLFRKVKTGEYEKLI